jgi:hypothetical protein
MTALDPDLASLLRRLESGIAETTAKWKSQGTMIIVGSVAMAGLSAVRQIWFLVPVCLLFGVGIYFLMNAATRNSGPEKAAPVLEALRIAPGRITKIGHRITSDSKRLFVTHWIDVVSDEGHIMVRADDDWRPLLGQLARRCPQATVTGAE